MPGTALLEIVGVSKRFGAQAAVDDLSFDIAAGEIVGFVGPNGAGKSTTLRIITGLIRPDSGRVRLDGRELQADPTAFRRRLGVLIESPAYYPMLSAWEHLAYVGRLRRAYDRREIEQALADVGLAPDSRKRVDKFSLGMKQRLGIAMALFTRPALLVLDEPMNGLDPAGIADLRSFLRQLPERRGTSVLMSSHLLGEVEQVCHRVVFIRQGRLAGQARLTQGGGNGLIRMWVRTGHDAGAVAALRGAAFVADASTEVAGVSCCVAADDVPKLAPLLVAAGIEIFELTSRGGGLEETYLAHYRNAPAEQLR
jgi:ABC-type multidrug transport system ATPase subunit